MEVCFLWALLTKIKFSLFGPCLPEPKNRSFRHLSKNLHRSIISCSVELSFGFTEVNSTPESNLNSSLLGFSFIYSSPSPSTVSIPFAFVVITFNFVIIAFLPRAAVYFTNLILIPVPFDFIFALPSAFAFCCLFGLFSSRGTSAGMTSRANLSVGLRRNKTHESIRLPREPEITFHPESFLLIHSPPPPHHRKFFFFSFRSRI